MVYGPVTWRKARGRREVLFAFALSEWFRIAMISDPDRTPTLEDVCRRFGIAAPPITLTIDTTKGIAS